MSLAYRIWRLARHQVMLRLGLVQGAGFRGPGAVPTVPRERTTSPPRHPLEAEYRLLGAPVGASPETLRACWRERVRRIHPDRFAQDPVSQRCASEQLRLVNEAYRRIQRLNS